MIRNARLLVGFALALVIAACADGPTAAGDPIVRHRGSAPVIIEPGTCITLAELQTLAAEVFGAGSPDYNSVRGKLDNLQHQIGLGNTVETKGKAHDIVDFVLTKNEENAFPGQESLVEFVNGVYCFAGLDITMGDPSNSHLIFPDDQEQVVVSADERSGIRFDAFPVTAPTLITFIPEVSAPLNTKLDQYPGFFSVTAQADAEVILTKPATVGVCAQGVIPPEVRARLRLGHGLKTAEEATDYQGFEITPAADASFLQCANEVAVVPSSIGSRLWSRVSSLVLPAKAHAYQEAFGGGVGGTVTEFSPFAPVDPELNFGGGVGGTVTEFLRTWSSKNLGNDQALAVGGCSTIQAPIGSPVRSDCLPLVSVRTRLGTLFENVPIAWHVGLGGGTIAARTAGSCGALGASVADVTDALGISDICWTLGAEGANTVVATPALGGDAVDGVIFSPASRTFSATANPPSALAFTQQPSSTTAGAPIGLQVEVRDLNGERVIGYNGNVSVAIATGPVGGSLGGTTSERADAGLATFDDLVITKAGDYTLHASAPFLPGPAGLPVTDAFTVSPAAPTIMSIVQGNNVTAAAGSVVSPAPTVLVTDAYGNAIGGLAVEWTAALSSTSSANPGSTTTGANGQTSTAWTLGDGPNQLRAELGSNPAVFVVFDATGTSTLVELNVCAPGGAKDPINDPSKPYAFYIPDPGNGKTIRQIGLYFSSQGRANQPTEYEVELTTQRATFDPAVSLPVATRARVNLRGNNSEDKLATFTLTQPIVGASGSSARAVMVRLRVVDNPDGATLTFNVGGCSPGVKSCKVPPTCKATEVSNPLPYPLGTFHRASVGIRVKGN
jgi:hypothetical protein